MAVRILEKLPKTYTCWCNICSVELEYATQDVIVEPQLATRYATERGSLLTQAKTRAFIQCPRCKNYIDVWK